MIAKSMMRHVYKCGMFTLLAASWRIDGTMYSPLEQLAIRCSSWILKALWFHSSSIAGDHQWLHRFVTFNSLGMPLSFQFCCIAVQDFNVDIFFHWASMCLQLAAARISVCLNFSQYFDSSVARTNKIPTHCSPRLPRITVQGSFPHMTVQGSHANCEGFDWFVQQVKMPLKPTLVLDLILQSL